ncbi:site-2 protease family protein [Oscillatoriales cyanobacterium LEGE 11467]|uniref:Site-2 protease family protein n=1 Tax=Zarconia navalis LEGE 11467 TaxID=1828826 RepID=A0A928VVQ7_9CYAN|nr:site-2 protease family protein [Zarconia navalis]MBE9041046.1 site-2 protease family protein [Zarconia navalis LEGE 11467]
MNFWLLLLLGLLTYLILQRSVPRITRTPIWILWLVMMTPASILTVWALIYGEDANLPAILAIGPFAICFVLYWWLVQRGRISPKESQTVQTSQVLSNAVEMTPNLEEETPEQPPTRTIDREEEGQLRDCFPWSVYYLRNLEYRPQVVVCRGQLRTNPDRAYQTIQGNIEKTFGDRFLVVFQEGFYAKQPFFILVPNPQAESKKPQESEATTRPIFALSLLLITLFTTTVSGAVFAGVDEAALRSDPARLWEGLSYSLPLIAILGVHEFGHYFAARFHHIRSTLPYLIPFPFFLGTVGAFTQMRSPIPDRKALFDVSVIGPLAGLAISIPLLVWGMAHSQVVLLSALENPDSAGLLNFEALKPQFSLLLSVVSKLALGDSLNADTVIDLNLVAIAGYLGLILTAFNLLPVGQLDGGHMVHAMFGQRTALGIAQVTRLLMLVLALAYGDRKELLFGAIVLFLMPIRDEPALNDVSELDNRRDFIGLMALALLAAILLPAPKVLTQALGF